MLVLRRCDERPRRRGNASVWRVVTTIVGIIDYVVADAASR